jgi:hypothetical protein
MSSCREFRLLFWLLLALPGCSPGETPPPAAQARTDPAPASATPAERPLIAVSIAQGNLSPVEADQQLAAIAGRLHKLSVWTADQTDRAGLGSAAVVCSRHQAAFCRYLGLNVAATFSAADTAQPSQIDRAVKAGQEAQVRWIVANRPEGRQLADALGERLGATVAVFGNFPEKLGPQAFDELVRANVTALVKAAQP